MHYRSLLNAASLFVLFASLLGPRHTTAQTPPPTNPMLLKDVNTAETEDSSPFNFMPAGLVTYFFAKQADGQTTLWKTNGTTEGTTFVRTGMQPSQNTYAILNGFLYYPAYNEVNGTELWRIDLATDQTSFFFDNDPGSSSSDPCCLTTFEGRIYYAARYARIQSTDGTPEGTTLNGSYRPMLQSRFMEFKNSLYYSAYQPDYIGGNDRYYLAWFGSGGSGQTTGLYPDDFVTIYKDRLYFTARRSDVGSELWSMDGTAESVQLLRDVNPGVGDANISAAAEYNGLLYFTAQDAIYGQRLWATDGSEAGTVPVYDPPDSTPYIGIVGTVQPSGPENPGGLLISLNSRSGDSQLWRFDGTDGGTQLLSDLSGFVLENEDQPERREIFFNNVYYFYARDAVHGGELWRTDGTVNGTARLADIWPGPHSSMPSRFAPCGNRLCFKADDGVHGKELWQTDGTPEGTTLVADLNTHPSNAYPWQFTRAGDLVYFLARDAVADANLWRTDGTPQGTFALNFNTAVNFERNRYNFPLWATAGKTLFFTASDPEHGFELWKTDGTLTGTKLLKDINHGAASSYPERLIMAGDKLFFTATIPEAGEKLWVSDGTEAGTRMVQDLVPNESGQYLTGLAGLGNRVALSIYHSDIPACELWITNGSSAGTIKVFDDACLQNRTGANGAEFDGKLYFSAKQTNGSIYPLWVSDGTPEGTRMVSFTDGNGRYFSDTDITDMELTNTGLYIVSGIAGLYRIPPGEQEAQYLQSFDGLITDFAEFGQNIAMIVNMNTDGILGADFELWVSDGTRSGTRLIEGGFGTPESLMPLGGSLFFSAIDANGKSQIWQTDGTNERTYPVISFAQTRCTTMQSADSSLAQLNGRFILTLDDTKSNPPGSGCELWIYDIFPVKIHLPFVMR